MRAKNMREREREREDEHDIQVVNILTKQSSEFKEGNLGFSHLIYANHRA